MAPTRKTTTQPTISGLLQPPARWGAAGRGAGLKGDAGGGGDWGSIRSSGNAGSLDGAFVSPPDGADKPEPPMPPIMRLMEYEPLPTRPSRSSRTAPQGRRLLRWTWPVLLALVVGAVAGVGVAAAIHVPRVEALASTYTPR